MAGGQVDGASTPDEQHDWLLSAAEQLGVTGLDQEEVAALLDLARDVAHNTERRFAPLTCFLVGVAAAGDRGRTAALARALGERAVASGD